ncbi:DMT family transporter [Leeia oryzae]|uniref:DMT family transporter n=1 Tax=Leeia oryzae TaxID=356662 RepID=UPI000367B852|nr:DMT family transporter [Leeia oryzae]
MLFIGIWSTGFIVGRMIVPFADPNLFLLARFLGASGLFLAVALATRAPWPARLDIPKQLATGGLLQGVYLGGGYWAVANGLAPAGMALLGALQPVFTACLAGLLLGEAISRRFWLGLVIGVSGVVMVLLPPLMTKGAGHVSAGVVLVAVIAILSITCGTLLQKSWAVSADLRTASVYQNLGAALTAGVIVWLMGEQRWLPHPVLWGSLAWAAIMLSGLGTSLLIWLVRRGKASTVSSLMFLAPPLAAVEAWWLFGDRLTALQMLGFLVALLGVILCKPVSK